MTLTKSPASDMVPCTFHGRAADTRRVIYAVAMGPHLGSGVCSMDRFMATMERTVCARPQLHAINGRPC